ncbi:unnamed protein product [Protopolystoma xenopodis]|uniref:Uncharacterized protein n=1 Tax=Protopolystoma xenopodis TaxID=117903 RepID=A0A3S5BU78_9PLAT|nr:unnamed protein product [Protopolystoma xenopodis]
MLGVDETTVTSGEFNSSAIAEAVGCVVTYIVNLSVLNDVGEYSMGDIRLSEGVRVDKIVESSIGIVMSSEELIVDDIIKGSNDVPPFSKIGIEYSVGNRFVEASELRKEAESSNDDEMLFVVGNVEDKSVDSREVDSFVKEDSTSEAMLSEEGDAEDRSVDSNVMPIELAVVDGVLESEIVENRLIEYGDVEDSSVDSSVLNTFDIIDEESDVMAGTFDPSVPKNVLESSIVEDMLSDEGDIEETSVDLSAVTSFDVADEENADVDRSVDSSEPNNALESSILEALFSEVEGVDDTSVDSSVVTLFDIADED